MLLTVKHIRGNKFKRTGRLRVDAFIFPAFLNPVTSLIEFRAVVTLPNHIFLFKK